MSGVSEDNKTIQQKSSIHRFWDWIRANPYRLVGLIIIASLLAALTVGMIFVPAMGTFGISAGLAVLTSVGSNFVKVLQEYSSLIIAWGVLNMKGFFKDRLGIDLSIKTDEEKKKEKEVAEKAKNESAATPPEAAVVKQEQSAPAIIPQTTSSYAQINNTLPVVEVSAKPEPAVVSQPTSEPQDTNEPVETASPAVLERQPSMLILAA